MEDKFKENNEKREELRVSKIEQKNKQKKVYDSQEYSILKKALDENTDVKDKYHLGVYVANKKPIIDKTSLYTYEQEDLFSPENIEAKRGRRTFPRIKIFQQ